MISINPENIEQVLKSYNIKLKIFEDKNFLIFIKDQILNLKQRNLSNDLISHNWQISIIEREKEKSLTKNKFDQVEIAMQFNSFDNKSNEYKKSLLNLNYYEFYEIFQNLKKIDSQLHLFKN